MLVLVLRLLLLAPVLVLVLLTKGGGREGHPQGRRGRQR